jgi:hypothetical protein
MKTFILILLALFVNLIVSDIQTCPKHLPFYLPVTANSCNKYNTRGCEPIKIVDFDQNEYHFCCCLEDLDLFPELRSITRLRNYRP